MKKLKRTKPVSISSKVKRSADDKITANISDDELRGDPSVVISTGSTLLDLAISGGVVRKGGLFRGTIIEIFGPNGSGKTILLCEIAGAVQRLGGKVKFHDPEARLNTMFAKLFDLDIDAIDYSTPDTVTKVFADVKKWNPNNDAPVNGIFTDSLAALSTDMEMDKDEGDKMGMRRAKEFSEGLRKTARIIKQRNLIMVCSNQIRQNANAGTYGEKYNTPGGQAFGFYASVRLQVKGIEKIKLEKTLTKKCKEKRTIGIETEIFVYKNSTDKPYRSAFVDIIFDYGIDNVRANLKYLKKYTESPTYAIGDIKLDVSLDKSIAMVEERNLERKLERKVIELWNEIENKFKIERKPKRR